MNGKASKEEHNKVCTAIRAGYSHGIILYAYCFFWRSAVFFILSFFTPYLLSANFSVDTADACKS
jgi:hypothetical protein